MPRSKKKDARSVAQERVVNISDYRSLQTRREELKIGVVSSDEELFETIKDKVGEKAKLELFDSRFAFEKALKQKEFQAVLLDERFLLEDALSLCEKLKRQSMLDALSVIIISNNSDKAVVRKGYENGCDEWITRLDDMPYLADLLYYYAGN